jgi:ornithine cyclodeaminase
VRDSLAGPVLLTDDEVERRLSPEVAIRAVRRALVEAEDDQPPRVRTDVGDRRVVLSAAAANGWVGLRLRLGGVQSDDVGMAWDETGALAAIVVGRELGVRRSGAVGALAVDALARPDAAALAVIGSGRQAWGQLSGIAAVRNLADVRVASPTAEHAARFADRARAELALDATASPDARTAVEGADVIVLATNSARPVIEAGWVGSGTHVSTIGRKSRTSHETPPELIDRAAVFVVDHPSQVRALDEQFFSTMEPVPLAAVLDGSEPGRRTFDDITVFCSAGLPAGDLALLRALAGA